MILKIQFSMLNLSLRRAFSGDVPSVIMAVTAVVFAVLGTVLLAMAMQTMGGRHRRFKDDSGWPRATGPMRRVVLVEQAVLISAATVMAARLYVEGRTAAAPTVLIAALAVTFTLLRGVSTYINYVSELQDGSEATDRILLLSGQLLGRKQKLRDLQNNRALLIEEAGIEIATLERLIAAGLPGYSAAKPRMRHAPGWPQVARQTSG